MDDVTRTPDGDPGHAESIPGLLEHARILLATGQPTAAINLLEPVAARHPHNDPIHRQLAHCHRQLGNHEQSLNLFQHAWALSPNDPNLPIRISEDLRTLHQYDQALTHITTHLATNPNSIPGLLEHARILLATGQPSSARGMLEQVVRVAGSEIVSYPAPLSLLCVLGKPRFVVSLIIRRRTEIVASHALPLSRLCVEWRNSRVGVRLAEYLHGQSRMSSDDLQRLRAFAAHSDGNHSDSIRELEAVPLIDHRPLDEHLMVSASLAALRPKAAVDYYDQVEAARRLPVLESTSETHRTGRRIRRGLLFEIANEMNLDLLSSKPRDSSLAKAIRAIRLHVLRCGQPVVSAQTRSHSSVISHRLTQLWVGSEVPGSVTQMHDLWAQYFEPQLCRLESGEVPFDFCRDHLGGTSVDVIRRLRHPAAQTDLLRLVYLHALGGIWSDVDDFPLTNPTTWFPHDDLVVYQEDRGNLGNNFIAAIPGHPAIERAMEWGLEAAKGGFTESIWLATGPGLLTRAVGSWLTDRETESECSKVAVFDRRLIRRLVAMGISLDYKATLNSWQRAEGHTTAPTAPVAPPPMKLQATTRVG